MNENSMNFAVSTRFHIDQSVLDAVAEQGARSGNYSSIEKMGGFKISGLEKILPELRGVIDDFSIYQGKFDGKKFLKRDATGPESDGYQNRADIYLQISPEYTTTLSLPKTSTTAAINYFMSLKARNITPNQVVTKITTKIVTGQYGPYSIAVFEDCGPAHQQSPTVMKNITPVQITQEVFTPPPVEPSTSQIPSAWL